MIVNVESGCERPWEWDPFLVPRWRFQDAQRLARGEDATWLHDDPAILSCVEYLKALATATLPERAESRISGRY